MERERIIPPSTQVMPQHTQVMPLGNETLILGAEPETEEATHYIHIGSVLNSKYTLTKVIAENTGEAALFLCRSEENTYVAKIYHQNKEPKGEIVERIRELSSPYVIPILDDGRRENRYFEILPYYEERDLLAAAPLDARLLAGVVIPSVNEGLRVLHEQGIIHRDIKPNNLFFADGRTRVVIGDFGISSVVEDRQSVRHTSASRTLGYSAPETSTGFVSKESDYYSLGITLLYLVTGIDPFAGMTEQQILKMTLTDKLIIPSSVDARIAHLIRGLTVKERKDRWGYEEIEKWLRGEQVAVKESNPATLHVRPYQFAGRDIYDLDELALALAEQWQEGIKHLYRGLIKDHMKQFGQEYLSRVMDCEEERNHDVGLYHLIYVLSPKAPLCWKGEVFSDLKHVGKAMHDKLPSIDSAYLELLQTGMLLDFLQRRSANPKLVEAVVQLQNIAKKDSSLAYYRLYYLLYQDNGFSFKQFCFRSVDELVQYLHSHSDYVEEISKELLEQPCFFAWLEHLGFAEHVAQWRTLQHHWEKRETENERSKA
jgi:hypothetical protein